MINLIIEALEYVEPTTEVLKQAKGYYKLPTNIKEFKKWKKQRSK